MRIRIENWQKERIFKNSVRTFGVKTGISCQSCAQRVLMRDFDTAHKVLYYRIKIS